jgi:hypothetical protein
MEPDETPPTLGTDRMERSLRRGLSTHILPTSATMVGVCMTVLSIGHFGPGGELRMMGDKLLAVDALVFLVSAMLSFMSMRSHHIGARYETRAEQIFIAGLGMLAMVALVMAFSIT